MGRQAFSHLQESRAPSHVMVTGEDKCCNSERSPLPPSSPQLYMLSVTLYGMENPFGQLGSALTAVSPPNYFCTPSLLAGGVG